jgi:hypothetical protein
VTDDEGGIGESGEACTTVAIVKGRKIEYKEKKAKGVNSDVKGAKNASTRGTWTLIYRERRGGNGE